MSGPIDSIKGAFVKAALGKLTDGNHGSTALGTIAAGLLASNINFGLVVQGFHTMDSAMECGKLLGALVLVTWGYFTGKKKQETAVDPNSK